METDRDRLFEHVERLATVPRPYGSIELEQAQQYVTGQHQESGWSVERRDFDVVNDWGDLKFGETLTGTNLVATHSRAFVKLGFSISAVFEVVETFLRGEFIDELTNSFPQSFDGALGRFA